MTRIKNSDKVQLSTGNWLAIVGIIVGQIGIFGSFMMRLEHRLTKLETKMETIESRP